MKINIHLKYFFIHTFIPLFLGTVIYWFATPAGSIIAKGFTFLEKIDIIKKWKVSLQTDVNFPAFVAFQIPDALWAYAFCATFIWIWGKTKAAFAGILAFTLCSFYEIAQFIGLLDGTFDWWDIFALSLGCFCAYFLSIFYSDSNSELL